MKVLNKQQSGFFDFFRIFLTAFDNNNCCWEVFLLLAEHNLNSKLVLHGLEEGVVEVMRDDLAAGHNGQVKVEDQWCQFPHLGAGSFNSLHFSRD